jgi:periplasmic divalent cation tolerance protein
MFASVLVTVPDLKIAETIAFNLIDKGLAACANYFPTRSIYRWKEKIEMNEEMIMILKIRASDFELVSKEIVRLHPYEVPCIVKYEISDGFQPYLDWVKESTNRSQRD